MGAAAGLTEAQRRSLAARSALMRPAALAKLVSGGFVNAEWLLCGTGPMRPTESPEALSARVTLPVKFASSFPTFCSSDTVFETPAALEPTSTDDIWAVTDTEPLDTVFLRSVARAVHQARSADKPVILALGQEAIYDEVGPVVAELLRRGYVTGLAFTSSAAAADLELAMFGGQVAETGLLQKLTEMHTAARLAASHGLGYGEALGRWAYQPESNRAASALSVAYELNLPVTVHAAIGESAVDFLPAKHGAEIGAAIGAASYVDLLVFTQELLLFSGNPGGLFLNADNSGLLATVFHNAINVVQPVSIKPIDNYRLHTIFGRYRRAFPALLAFCDAVYAGSADDER
jgi:hypothetical protein